MGINRRSFLKVLGGGIVGGGLVGVASGSIVTPGEVQSRSHRSPQRIFRDPG